MGRFAGPSGTVVIGHREPLAGTKQYSAHGYPGTLVRYVLSACEKSSRFSIADRP